MRIGLEDPSFFLGKLRVFRRGLGRRKLENDRWLARTIFTVSAVVNRRQKLTWPSDSSELGLSNPQNELIDF